MKSITHCRCCGAIFEQDAPNQKYCSIPCQKLVKHKTDYNRVLRKQLPQLRLRLEQMTEASPEKIKLEEKIKRMEATIKANHVIILGYDDDGRDCNGRTEYENYMPEEQRMLRRDELARRCGCLSPQNN